MPCVLFRSGLGLFFVGGPHEVGVPSWLGIARELGCDLFGTFPLLK